MNILFKQEALEKSEADFKQIKIAPGQAEIVGAIAKLMVNYVPMSELAMKGFIWRALTDWQVESKMTTDQIATSTPDVRIREMGKAFDNLKGYLNKVVRNVDDIERLDSYIDQAFQFYKDNFAKR